MVSFKLGFTIFYHFDAKNIIKLKGEKFNLVIVEMFV